MKVILLQDVAKIGRRHSVVEVPAGFAQNSLIPRRKALIATPENLKKLQHVLKDSADLKAEENDRFTSAVTALQAEPLIITLGANDHGHLFEAVKAAHVVEAAHAKGAQLQDSEVSFREPIKSLGEHVVFLMHGGVRNEVSLLVKAA